MQSEQSKTQRETLSSGSQASMSRNQLETYAAQRAALLCGCYRRGDANDPDTYIAAVAAVLAMFDFDIIREATDPRLGISTSEKFRAFMPNSGELKAYCDALAERKERLKKLAAIPRPVPSTHRLEAPEAPAGSWANVHVPEADRRYAKLCEWAAKNEPKFSRYGVSSDGVPGIWVALHALDSAPAKPQQKPAPDWQSLKLGPETLAATFGKMPKADEGEVA
jgi:hypothetical protein